MGKCAEVFASSGVFAADRICGRRLLTILVLFGSKIVKALGRNLGNQFCQKLLSGS